MGCLKLLSRNFAGETKKKKKKKKFSRISNAAGVRNRLDTRASDIRTCLKRSRCSNLPS